MSNLTGKVAIVTRASKGSIRAAVAKAPAAEGAAVAVAIPQASTALSGPSPTRHSAPSTCW
jgi:NAD(P)-dependent dehydrogenase (short-subunit alcohol dehydrogenase family)